MERARRGYGTLSFPTGGAGSWGQWAEALTFLISEYLEDTEPFTLPRVNPASTSPECYYPERVCALSLPWDALPTWPSGSLALEFSFLRGKGGAHVLPQMRLWKEREAGLEQAEEDKRDFSGVMSAERATQTLMPKMASGIFQDSRFHQVWSGPVCLRTSSRADLRQLPGGSQPR